jgi:tetratricopeptide (TPR) repeat protein
MSYYAEARQFHWAGIIAAQEANNRPLESIAWGRLSLAWIYSGNIQKALGSVQQARDLIMWNNTMVKAWLAAIEAEVWANLADPFACLKALDEAEQIEDQSHFMEDSYLVYFDRSLLGGYQGACFYRLHQLQDIQSTIYLEKAQNALINALALLDPTLIQRQPTFLTDLATTYAQQGEIEEACGRAIQAVTIAAQIKLQKVISRLLTLRHELEPWKDTQYVQALDSYLAPLFAPDAKR